MDGILVGLLSPFLSQTLPLRKTNQTERLCRQTAPGSLRCQALEESCVQMLHLRQGRRAAEKQESTAEVETRRD